MLQPFNLKYETIPRKFCSSHTNCKDSWLGGMIIFSNFKSINSRRMNFLKCMHYIKTYPCSGTGFLKYVVFNGLEKISCAFRCILTEPFVPTRMTSSSYHFKSSYVILTCFFLMDSINIFTKHARWLLKRSETKSVGMKLQAGQLRPTNFGSIRHTCITRKIYLHSDDTSVTDAHLY